MSLPIIYDVNKSIKENGFKKTVVILFLIIILFQLPLIFFSRATNTKATDINVSTQVGNPTKDVEGDSIEPKNLIFSEHLNDWNFDWYKDSDGYLCSLPLSPFQSPDIWFKSSIHATFKQINIRYKIKNNSRSRTFVFSLGRRPRIFRFFIPQENPQSVGFQKFFLEGNEEKSLFVRGQDLSNPIKENTIVEINVRSFIKKENLVTYTLNINYISSLTGAKKEDTFSYDIELADPNPAEYLTELGIATISGNCIKPLSYQLVD